jgi:hypothetical protein
MTKAFGRCRKIDFTDEERLALANLAREYVRTQRYPLAPPLTVRDFTRLASSPNVSRRSRLRWRNQRRLTRYPRRRVVGVLKRRSAKLESARRLSPMRRLC